MYPASMQSRLRKSLGVCEKADAEAAASEIRTGFDGGLQQEE